LNFSITGSHEENTFDERVFNVGTLIGFFITFTSVIINQLNAYPLIYHIELGSLSVLFAFMYYLSRFKKLSRYLKIPFVIVFTLCNVAAWFFSGGINGSTTFLIIFSVIGAPFIIKTSRTYVFIFIFITASTLIATQLLFPEIIIDYPDEDSKLIDITVTFVLVLGISAYTMHIYNSLYENEKKTIEKQNRELELQKIELAEKNNKLYELDRFKEMMTGMIIHDLKNPLGSIIGLSEQKVSEHNLKIIKQSGKNMLNIVMNILDVQKFESTQLLLTKEEHSLSDVLKSAVNEISVSVNEKKLNLVISNNADCSVVSDKVLIIRVLVNILSNAVKYSENNSKLNIETEHLETENKIKISITDFGQGISEEKIPFVFEKFAQINSINTGSMRSTGLGLAFCKLVVEAHGNEIGVESEVGKYTTFWFTLNKADNLLPSHNKDVNMMPINKHLILDEKEAKYLRQHIDNLKHFKYYETGKIIPVLNLIDEKFSEGVKKWKLEMEDSVYTNNKEKFDDLLSENKFI